jgi:hypothetical protein
MGNLWGYGSITNPPSDTDLVPVFHGSQTKDTPISGLLKNRTVTATIGFSNADYICDGVADDVEIQTALNAVNTAGGGRVHIRAHSTAYDISAVLKIPSNVWLSGEGWGTVLKAHSNTVEVLNNSDFTNISGGNTNIIVSDLQINGNNTTGTVTSTDGAFTFDYTSNVKISGVCVVDSGKEGIKVRHTSNATISQCNINTTPPGAAGITAATGSSNITVMNNVAVDAGGEAFGGFLCTDLTLVGNTSQIINGGRGHILLEGTGSSINDCVVSGNKLETDYYGINVINGIGISITGNEIRHFNPSSTNAFDGINISGTSKYLTINSNTIHDIAQNGININGTTRRLTILGNTIINPSSVTSNTYDGIVLSAGGGAIRDINMISNIVVDDRITTLMRNGINLVAGVQQIVNPSIADNTIVGYLSAGYASSGTIISETIRNNTGINPDTLFVKGNITGATTFTRVNGQHIVATLTGNVTTTITNGAVKGDRLTLELTQDGTGSRTISKPSNARLVGGAFSPTVAANATDIWMLEWDGTNWVEVSRSLNIS